jgi:hypothetical protein
MGFEIRKINDVGVSHPVVARLGVQASGLIPWIDIEDAKRKEIAELYARMAVYFSASLIVSHPKIAMS